MASGIFNSHFDPWRHLPPLLMATGQALGGLTPFYNPASAIRGFGLPEHIASSQPAQLSFKVYGSRATIIGVAMWIFYTRGDFRAVDTLMLLNAYGCAVDGYVSALEGERRKAWFRAGLALFVGGWGWLRLTSGGVS